VITTRDADGRLISRQQATSQSDANSFVQKQGKMIAEETRVQQQQKATALREQQKVKQQEATAEKLGPRRAIQQQAQAPPRRKEREETKDVLMNTDNIKMPIRKQSFLYSSKEEAYNLPKDKYSKIIGNIRHKGEEYEIKGIRQGGIIGRYKQTTGALISAGYFPIRTPEAVYNLGKSAVKGAVIGAGATALGVATGGGAIPIMIYGGGAYASTKVTQFDTALNSQQNPVQSREFIAQKGAETLASIGGGYLGASAVSYGVGSFNTYKENRFRQSVQPKKENTYEWTKEATQDRTPNKWEDTLLKSKSITPDQKAEILNRIGYKEQSGVKIIGSKEAQLQLKPKSQLIEKSSTQQPLKPDVMRNYWDTADLGQREYLGKYTAIPQTGSPIYKTRFFPSKSNQYTLIGKTTGEAYKFKTTSNPLTPGEIAKATAPRTGTEKLLSKVKGGLDKLDQTALMGSKKANVPLTDSGLTQSQTKVYPESSLLETTPKSSIAPSNTYTPPQAINKVYGPILSLSEKSTAQAQQMDQGFIMETKKPTVYERPPIQKQVIDQRYIIRPREVEKSDTSFRFKVSTRQDSGEIQEQQPKKPIEKPVIPVITIEPPGQTPGGSQKKIIKPIFVPTPNIRRPPKDNNSFNNDFNVLVRRQGTFRDVGQFGSLREAFIKGRGIVENTAGASFKVEDKEGRVQSGGLKFLNNNFYASKREQGVFIEKRENRISTAGEKGEITFKGLFAIKTQSKTKTKNKGGFSIF